MPCSIRCLEPRADRFVGYCREWLAPDTHSFTVAMITGPMRRQFSEVFSIMAPCYVGKSGTLLSALRSNQLHIGTLDDVKAAVLSTEFENALGGPMVPLALDYDPVTGFNAAVTSARP